MESAGIQAHYDEALWVYSAFRC